MTSEIRVNKIENRSGLGTVTFADTGVDLAGIVTATTFSGSGASLTNVPDSALSAVTASKLSGALPAISGANLTALNGSNIASGTVADARISTLTASKLSGALPAISAASLTQIPAANIVGVCTSGLGNASGAFGQTGQGITVHDWWGINADLSVSQGENTVTANWFRHNTINGTIGSAMSQSGGIFTFPSTGIYFIKINANYYESSSAGHNYAGFYIKYSTDGGSSYNTGSFGGSAMNNYGGTTYEHATCSMTFDVTDVSTHRIAFNTIASGGSMVISGTTSYNNMWAEFTRLGDT